MFIHAQIHTLPYRFFNESIAGFARLLKWNNLETFITVTAKNYFVNNSLCLKTTAELLKCHKRMCITTWKVRIAVAFGMKQLQSFRKELIFNQAKQWFCFKLKQGTVIWTVRLVHLLVEMGRTDGRTHSARLPYS